MEDKIKNIIKAMWKEADDFALLNRPNPEFDKAIEELHKLDKKALNHKDR